MGGGRTFFLDLTVINIRTLSLAQPDEMLSLYAYIKNSKLFNMKLKNAPQFCSHVWICHLLEHSRIVLIGWGLSTLRGPVNTCDSKNPCFLPLSFRIAGGNTYFFQPKSVMKSWLRLNLFKFHKFFKNIFLNFLRWESPCSFQLPGHWNGVS